MSIPPPAESSSRIVPQLVMARITLEGLPPLTPPPGYVARHYRPGDEEAWDRLISDSFGGNGRTFRAIIAGRPTFQPQRVWFIEAHGELVATASAWRDGHFGHQTGYVHMVGVSSRERGRHLGYWVSLAALHRMVDEGINHAVLQTDDDRLAAIVTYQRLGFQPLLVHENQAARWREIYEKLGKKE